MLLTFDVNWGLKESNILIMLFIVYCFKKKSTFEQIFGKLKQKTQKR